MSAVPLFDANSSNKKKKRMSLANTVEGKMSSPLSQTNFCAVSKRSQVEVILLIENCKRIFHLLSVSNLIIWYVYNRAGGNPTFIAFLNFILQGSIRIRIHSDLFTKCC